MKTINGFKECYPFYQDRAKTKKYFPISYVIFPHDTGDRFTPKNKNFPDWKDGIVQKLVDDGLYQFNSFYVIGLDNTAAWGRPQERSSQYWTTTDTYVRFLDFLEEKYVETNGKFDAKGIVKITSRDDKLNIYSTGTWDNIPHNDIETFIERIKILGKHKRLLAHAISDEPYAGDFARKLGIRDKITKELQYLKQLILENDPNINDHFIYMVERPDGNFGYDFIKDPSKKYLLNGLQNMCDYYIDNIYSYDYELSTQNSPDKDPYNWIINRPKYIIDNLIEQVHGVDLGSQKASLILSQGMIFNDCPFSNGDFKIPEELLRFQNYHCWINSLLGCSFWNLSKSDSDSYAKVKNISFEAFKASEYLMNPSNEISNSFTASINDNDNVEFVIRQHPVLKNKLMLMFSNLGTTKLDKITFNYNNTVKINDVDPLVSTYSTWSGQLYGYNNTLNTVSFKNIEPRTSRAYILDFSSVTPTPINPPTPPTYSGTSGVSGCSGYVNTK